jgi:hypothetical protein
MGAGEGNRTLMTSLEGWGSAIELRPRARQAGSARRVSTDSVPVWGAQRRTTAAGVKLTAGADGASPCRGPVVGIGPWPAGCRLRTVQRDVAQLG